MGLSNKKSNQQTFVTIVGGKFTIRLQDGDTNPDAVERVLEKGPNAGKTVRELQFTHLDGMIESGEMHQSDFGTDFTLIMSDGDESFKFQIPLESQYFGQVAKRLSNIDHTKNVVFGLGWDKEKQRNFLFIQQDGVSVHMNYTKDNPNGMPPPVKKTVKGQDKWDFEDQENFLYDVAIDWLAGLDGQTRAEPAQEPAPDEDGIPF